MFYEWNVYLDLPQFDPNVNVKIPYMDPMGINFSCTGKICKRVEKTSNNQIQSDSVSTSTSGRRISEPATQ